MQFSKENNTGRIIFLKYKCIFHKRIVLSSSGAEILLHNFIDFRYVTTVQTKQRTQPTVVFNLSANEYFRENFLLSVDFKNFRTNILTSY